MSEPKLISPLLDGYVIGAPISNRNGVCCCPAIREDSENKYIVKIISVPSSQRQLDALLITGAYSDAASAMEYFRETAEGIAQEAVTLRKLSKLEGFLSCEDWQTVPMEGNELGYQVYLLSPYRLSLEKYMRRNLMTHLSAVNLGLDLCAAAAICRNAGFMYVDLKPSNIFISEDKEYRIGDLGFTKLDCLKYNSMPAKYISRYTAPEVLDPMATLNDRVDIYAIGLVLYQIYNNGELPFGGNAVAEVFPAPVNADYEMAEIIAKACAPDPKDRWETPMEMGQALVDYMQRNTINDTPIAPPTVRLTDGDEAADPAEAAEQAAEAVPEELAFMEDMVSDDTAPGEADAEAAEPVTQEVSSILAQADDLIAQEAPEPMSTQETIRVPVGSFAGIQAAAQAAETAEPAAQAEPAREASPFDEFFDDEDDDYDEDGYEEDDYFEDDTPVAEGETQPRKKTWLVFLILGILFAGLCAGGFFLYKNYYVQTIGSLTADTHENQVTIYVHSDIDDSLLTLSCSDAYGNTKTQQVADGQATFTDLLPDTHYRVQAQISGFHKLEGSTTVSFTSEEKTELVEFTAVTGPQDGSAVLEFTLEGHDAQDWVVTWSAEGEEEESQSFTGHMVTINGLTLGKTYTFTLTSAVDLYLVGDNTLDFTASNIVLAQDLHISATSGESLTAQWSAPEGVSVESWTVRCYSEGGYDQSQVVKLTTASFADLQPGQAYTIEVTAAGMTQPVRTTLTADPISITELKVDDSVDGKLTISWTFTGEEPEGGWLLLYTMDNGTAQSIVTTKTATAEISPRIPGAVYHFRVQTAGAGSVFNADHTYSCPNAPVFKAHTANVALWKFDLCRTPDRENWTPGHVKAADYVTSFKPGEKISFVMVTNGHVIPSSNTEILYVIRDKEGNVLPELIATEAKDWKLMWNITYPRANLTLPKAPETPGEYQLYLYFNNSAAAVMDFTIAE